MTQLLRPSTFSAKFASTRERRAPRLMRTLAETRRPSARKKCIARSIRSLTLRSERDGTLTTMGTTRPKGLAFEALAGVEQARIRRARSPACAPATERPYSPSREITKSRWRAPRESMPSRKTHPPPTRFRTPGAEASPKRQVFRPARSEAYAAQSTRA